MLHILGVIGKIIGILLLVLLGLILAAILAVLFVPIGYKLQGEKTEKEISGKASVYWLFHLIHVRVQYLDKKIDPEIYIFGIPVLSVKRKLEERKKAAKPKAAASGDNAAQKEDTVSGDNTAQKEDTVSGNNAAQKEDTASGKKAAEPKEVVSGNHAGQARSTAKTAKTVETVKKAETAKTAKTTKTVPMDKNAEPDSVMKKENFLVKFFGSIKSCLLRIFQIPQKMISRFRKIKLTIKGICDKIRRWKEFLTLDTTKRALQFLLGRGRGILKHILPKKMKGNLIYGFDDPALTGQLLGAFAVFYPVYRNRLQITPVFDHAVLEGKLELKGRIFTVYLAVQALRILLQKDVKVTYRRLQNKEA